MSELEPIEARPAIRIPRQAEDRNETSVRFAPLSGILSGPIFTRTRDIIAANMSDLLDRSEDPVAGRAAVGPRSVDRRHVAAELRCGHCEDDQKRDDLEHAAAQPGRLKLARKRLGRRDVLDVHPSDGS